jgi:dihydrofolate reductase
VGKIVLDMSVSVDGFVTGPEDDAEHGLGVGGERLHAWLGDGGADPQSYRPGAGGADAQVFDEMLATGAVLVGRRTFEIAGGWDGDHHDGVPIFVLTRNPPPEPAPGHATYVTDVKQGAAEAKDAAGERDVMMHGASAAQACLRAGVLDEMELHVIPVLLGRGRRLFDGERAELDLVRALDGAGAQHLRYRVRAA